VEILIATIEQKDCVKSEEDDSEFQPENDYRLSINYSMPLRGR